MVSSLYTNHQQGGIYGMGCCWNMHRYMYGLYVTNHSITSNKGRTSDLYSKGGMMVDTRCSALPEQGCVRELHGSGHPSVIGSYASRIHTTRTAC